MTYVPVVFTTSGWGYARTVPETAVAPTLEEIRGEGPRNGHRTTGLKEEEADLATSSTSTGSYWFGVAIAKCNTRTGSRSQQL